jgi:hypothetical protein
MPDFRAATAAFHAISPPPPSLLAPFLVFAPTATLPARLTHAHAAGAHA